MGARVEASMSAVSGRAGLKAAVVGDTAVICPLFVTDRFWWFGRVFDAAQHIGTKRRWVLISLDSQFHRAINRQSPHGVVFIDDDIPTVQFGFAGSFDVFAGSGAFGGAVLID